MTDGAGALLAGLRRFGGLLAVVAGLTAGLALLAGLALGAGAERSVATGLYVVGAFLLVLGVFAGIRGPLRPRGDDETRDPVGGLFGLGVTAQGVRTASADERTDARATTWLFLTLGVALLVLGVVVDGRTSLV